MLRHARGKTMGVLLQSFFWDCCSIENSEGRWWDRIISELTALKQDGFTALWLPPASKAAEWNSMGYDVYDYFDLGSYDQKGRQETWFGTQQALLNLIQAAHANSLQVYADVVLNHNSGADEQEKNGIDGQLRWTKFTPRSGKFPRDWRCFHPSPYETMDGFESFGGLPDLCHRNPQVYAAIMEYTRWLIEEIGFDGFRFDFVKGYGSWMVKGIAEYRYERNGGFVRQFCVGECWDSDRVVDEWLTSVNNAFMDNPVSAFDFPLHYKLKGLCDQYGFDLRTLISGTVVERFPFQAATFVDNHDTVRDGGNAVMNDKMLAYAVLLTGEGYPSVFWQDYFNFGLAARGTPNGIAALIQTHEKYAGGASTVLFCDHDLYIMQR
ncbi:MAG TPA: alpha-amylase family glycosyl hydrolase, partial [Candidatus Sulfotelmatobacter sp.]|nr:alpha-amylase family glycosyl hydrolase [Candidatus Sulfotelmatobacter sp.]